jgi:hypothetical protein
MPASEEENSPGNSTCIVDYRLKYCILEEVSKINITRKLPTTRLSFSNSVKIQLAGHKT